jgi:DNA-binding XRE family transcriptional regulator
VGELAREADVGVKTVQLVEEGHLPRLSTALKLASALNTSVATLWPEQKDEHE